MRARILESLAEVTPAQWNALVHDGHPFLRHEFLMALERHNCVGEASGWLPRHIVCLDDQGGLIGASPLYAKTNSYGEFVFDWSWADAYRRFGLSYYPKLVSAIPFTPVSGQRLLRVADQRSPQIARTLIDQALELCHISEISSLHWLFTNDEDTAALVDRGYLLRLGCQFHWHNPGYRDFQDFLDSLTAKKRKNINRERRQVAQAGLAVRVLRGSELSETQWHAFHRFYCDTFHRLGGYPTLTLPFFLDIASTLGERILLVLALKQGREVAAAISFLSDHTLYGRHWGCQATYDSLHFEVCYYQGIDYCIRQGLQTFEPGAQGEHKIWRGFLPRLTRSAHWLADSGFREAVADFLRQERSAIAAYARELAQHSPYRAEEAHNR